MSRLIPVGVSLLRVILQHERRVVQNQRLNVFAPGGDIGGYKPALAFAQKKYLLRINAIKRFDLVDDRVQGGRLCQYGCVQHAPRIRIAEIEGIGSKPCLRQFFGDISGNIRIVAREPVCQDDRRKRAFTIRSV